MRFFERFSKRNEPSAKKLFELETKVTQLERLLRDVINRKLESPSPTKKTEQTEKDVLPSIKIDHLQVDKVVIEKLDYANNFGQLGIKELTGKLNIGSSFEGDISKIAAEKTNKKTKVNFRAQQEANEKK